MTYQDGSDRCFHKNAIVDGIVYEQQTGSLLFQDVRYLLIRPETIIGFQKEITQAYGHEASEKLFAGGYTGGRLSSTKFRELHSFTNREIIDYMMSMGGQIGWGHFSLEEYDPKIKRMAITVAHSPFAESYGTASQGVCHLIRGVLTGMASVVFESECLSQEPRCLAKGDARCLFTIEVNESI